MWPDKLDATGKALADSGGVNFGCLGNHTVLER